MTIIDDILEQTSSLSAPEKIKLARALLDDAKKNDLKIEEKAPPEESSVNAPSASINEDKATSESTGLEERENKEEESEETTQEHIEEQNTETEDKFDSKLAAENQKIIEDEAENLDKIEHTDATKWEKFLALLFYPLPHRLLSSIVNWFMRIKYKPIKNLQIKLFKKSYHIDLDEAVMNFADDFEDFNSFFTRELKESARPINDSESLLCSPADGFVSQFGKIKNDRIIQAKGQDFSAAELLGGDKEMAALFEGGKFITIYLAPSNYHRLHMPIDGTLKTMLHVPGRLFSVAPFTVKTVPRIFARNERAVCLFQTDIGPVAMVLVGAMFVSSIETVWEGVITPPYGKEIMDYNYAPPVAVPKLKKGEEMGRFNMGSTVVLLFQKDAITFTRNIIHDMPIKMGEDLAAILSENSC